VCTTDYCSQPYLVLKAVLFRMLSHQLLQSETSVLDILFYPFLYSLIIKFIVTKLLPCLSHIKRPRICVHPYSTSSSQLRNQVSSLNLLLTLDSFKLTLTWSPRSSNKGVCNIGKCSTDNCAFRYTYALTGAILFVLSIDHQHLGYVSNAKLRCSKMSETKEELDVFCSTSSNALFMDLNVDWSGNSQKSTSQVRS
jgi:hypothetical protein